MKLGDCKGFVLGIVKLPVWSTDFVCTLFMCSSLVRPPQESTASGLPSAELSEVWVLGTGRTFHLQAFQVSADLCACVSKFSLKSGKASS